MWLQVAERCFHFVGGIVPQLDCPVLLGHDCPVLAQLLRGKPVGSVEGKAVHAQDLPLPIEPGDLEWWQRGDPTIRNAWKSAEVASEGTSAF